MIKTPIWIAAMAMVMSDPGAAAELSKVQPGPIRYVSAVPGVDIGAEINALYESLPAGGGEIVVPESASFATPILFKTNGKPVLLVGLPGDIVTLTWWIKIRAIMCGLPIVISCSALLLTGRNISYRRGEGWWC